MNMVESRIEQIHDAFNVFVHNFNSWVAAGVRRLILKIPTSKFSKSEIGHERVSRIERARSKRKAVLKSPHSKRSAHAKAGHQSRSVWSAVALAPLSKRVRPARVIYATLPRVGCCGKIWAHLRSSAV